MAIRLSYVNMTLYYLVLLFLNSMQICNKQHYVIWVKLVKANLLIIFLWNILQKLYTTETICKTNAIIFRAYCLYDASDNHFNLFGSGMTLLWTSRQDMGISLINNYVCGTSRKRLMNVLCWYTNGEYHSGTGFLIWELYFFLPWYSFYFTE